MGGGIGMGNTCKPMAVLFQCMTKFTTNKKKKKKKYSVGLVHSRNVVLKPSHINSKTQHPQSQPKES